MIRTSPTGHVYRTPKRARHKEPQKVTNIPRLGHTYRSERRNAWRALGVDWTYFNKPSYEDRNLYGSGVSGSVTAHVARSKYMPHIGKKERARHTPA